MKIDTSLEDKLREILNIILPIYADSFALERTRVRKQVETNRIIVQIKQTFADEGYLKHDEFGVVNTYIHSATNVMTGQDWFDRFQKELEDGIKVDNIDGAWKEEILEAARKASGVSGDTVS